MSNGAKWGLAILGLIVLAQLTQSDDDGYNPPSYNTPSQSSTVSVIYRVSGTADQASITMSNSSGGTEQRTVDVPWMSTQMQFPPGEFVYISAQNEGQSGSVHCEILLGGTVVYSAQSSGAYTICTASGSASR